MELMNRLTEDEIRLLEEAGIEIKQKNYTTDDTGDIIEELDDAIRANLDENDNFTEKALAYERIQDKILEFENEL